MDILFYSFLIINGCAFVLTGYDKRLAIKNKRRIPEKTLLSLVVFGGTVGAGMAMFFFRHKTAKKRYLYRFFGILILQLLVIFGLYYYTK